MWIRISQPNPATNTQEIIKGSRQTTHVLANSLHAKKEEVTIFVVTSFSVWEHRDSNPGPSACKADALNQLSYTPNLMFRNHLPDCECKDRQNFSPTKFFLHFF